MANQPKKPFNKFLLYLLIILMVATGSMNTIVNKILQKLYGLDVQFEQHHWIITFGMFLGELVSIFCYAYIVYKRKTGKDENDEKLIEDQGNEKKEGEGEGETLPLRAGSEIKKNPPVPTNFIFGITAGCDLLASTLNTFGLTYLTSSMYQMMRGFELFFVCLWSKLFLKNPLYRHAILGVGTLIFGLSLVGLNAVLYDDKDVAKDPIVGIILLFISQFFSSTEYIFQEKFIKQYEVHPFQLVGFEGLWGSLMYSILLIIFQYCSCNSWSETLRDGICFKRNDTDSENTNNFNNTTNNTDYIYYIEDTEFAFRQMWDNKNLLILYIFYIVSISLYNIVGINLTKLVSSTARAVVDTVRTVFIWLFFLIFNPVEGTHETFHILQFIGFIFLVVGTLVYNEILVIPYYGLDYYTRDNIAKREREKEQGDEDPKLFPTDEEKNITSNEEKENNDSQVEHKEENEQKEKNDSQVEHKEENEQNEKNEQVENDQVEQKDDDNKIN